MPRTQVLRKTSRMMNQNMAWATKIINMIMVMLMMTRMMRMRIMVMILKVADEDKQDDDPEHGLDNKE